MSKKPIPNEITEDFSAKQIMQALAVAFLPLLLFFLIKIFVAPKGSFLFSAAMASLLIGCSLSMFFILKKAKKAAILLFAIGTIAIFLHALAMILPAFSKTIDTDLKRFYAASIVYCVLPPFFYISFRSSINSWLLSQKTNKRQLETLKKGMRNFWWYEDIHKAFDMGILYRANKIFTIYYPIACIFILLFGWIRTIAPLICLIYLPLSAAAAWMLIYSSLQSYREKYGTPFVVFKIYDRHGTHYDSSLIDFLAAGFLLYTAYSQIKMMLILLK